MFGNLVSLKNQNSILTSINEIEKVVPISSTWAKNLRTITVLNMFGINLLYAQEWNLFNNFC